MKPGIALLVLLLHAAPVPADPPLEIIGLRSRPADEVVPLIKPFAGPDGAVSGMNNQLFIRTSPERLEEIKAILEKVDRPPRRLLISVRQGSLTTEERQRISGGINVDGGGGASLELGEESPPDSARLRIRSTRTHGREDITQQVQTLEGKAAFIATGKSVPVSKQNMTVTGGVVIQQNTTEYRDVTTGFYVVPYLNGERVTLRISPHREKSASLGEGFDVQRADTTVSGYLGEWLSLGGIHQTGDETGTGLLRHRRTTGREEQQISVRVVELHR